jgi:hypothetical protein
MTGTQQIEQAGVTPHALRTAVAAVAAARRGHEADTALICRQAHLAADEGQFYRQIVNWFATKGGPRGPLADMPDDWLQRLLQLLAEAPEPADHTTATDKE